MTTARVNVLLLRAATADSGGGDDKYESAFRSIGFHPISVPVLETVLCNLDELQNLVVEKKEEFSGVIITSSRACEAWKHLVQQSTSTLAGKSSWAKTPFYVVGQTTRSALAEIAQSSSSRYAPCSIRGEHSGTGEQLARFITQDQPTRPCRLLYLTGDKNRDVLPGILRDAGIELHPLQVYATQGSHTFPNDLDQALRESNSSEFHQEWWTVFFAPSSAAFVLPVLRAHFSFHGENVGAQPPPSNLPKVKIAAIGPTTAHFLRETLHLTVDATASKPSPLDLVQSIVGLAS